MMASFLSESEQKEQTNREKYVFYCSVSKIHINPEKKHEKTHYNAGMQIHIRPVARGDKNCVRAIVNQHVTSPAGD